jgi:spore maturation protein CgeB
MKILLLFSGQSSLSHIFKKVFSFRSSDVEVINYLDFLPHYLHRLHDKSGKMPGGIEEIIRKTYLKKIQLKYIEIIKKKEPDIIFIYNDQMLCAETLDKINRDIKIGVYLADSPLFLQKRAHIIGLIRRADVVFAPDTFWLDQCKMLGVKKAVYLIPGFNEKHHYKIVPSQEQLKKYESDVFFMGSPYNDNWGYKRSLFLSRFCQFNFRLLGPETWNYWFSCFPELKEKFVTKKGYLSDDELNIMINCSKIIPVDANPGIINGFHVRVLDSIAAGVLPVVEYRRDLDQVFMDTDLPVIKNYNDIPELTAYYINHTTIRNDLIEKLQNTILRKYSIESAVNTIYSALMP